MKNKCLLCINVRQLNDANTMIKKFRHCSFSYSDMILGTFAAICETALESRNLCGLGCPEKPEKYTDFELS